MSLIPSVLSGVVRRDQFGRIADADLPTDVRAAARHDHGTLSRLVGDASAIVSYNHTMGFIPKLLLFTARDQADARNCSSGYSVAAARFACILGDLTALTPQVSLVDCIDVRDGAGNGWTGRIQVVTVGAFQINWVKSGAGLNVDVIWHVRG